MITNVVGQYIHVHLACGRSWVRLPPPVTSNKTITVILFPSRPRPYHYEVRTNVGWSCICVLGVSILPLSKIFYIGDCSYNVMFFVFQISTSTIEIKLSGLTKGRLRYTGIVNYRVVSQ